MRDLDYLVLLSHEYKNVCETAAEIINLKAVSNLPKGTEYFFSDLHGEHQAFIHMLRSCSGIIKDKIKETFGEELTEDEQLKLAELIYYPERKLEYYKGRKTRSREWQEKTIRELIRVAKTVSKKWDRHRVRENLPTSFAHIIDELLYEDSSPADKAGYYEEMMKTLLDTDSGYNVIQRLCTLIRSLLMDHLHIIGDIFDRGPRPDLIFDELLKMQKIDIQWGNHDVSWMGAALGCDACIATVLRIATSYNCFDVLEDGYGINMRPLSMFAQDVYRDDPCDRFNPHLLDENIYDEVDPALAAKMCKAISIIEFKLEGQLIKRHPEYRMDDRLMLHRINYETGEITVNGNTYKLRDSNFPTIDPADPYALSAEEQALVDVLHTSFTRSERLQEHIRFLFSHGASYLVRNNNLLFHGCIPMDEDGHFLKTGFLGVRLSGRELMDEIDRKCRRAFFKGSYIESSDINYSADIFWYLWTGAESPLFGKDKMATFENFFIDDSVLKKENYNPYYQHIENPETAMSVLEDFGIDGETGHIINGHVPVKVSKGEIPVKADGKVFVIDGGISKAYQKKTGIGGYTLIFNSHRLALAQHMPFLPGEEDTPEIIAAEEMPKRIMIKDTDEGKAILKQIHDLELLLEAYYDGSIKES